MFLRKAASILIKTRFRFWFAQKSYPASLSSTANISCGRSSKGRSWSFNHTDPGLWLFLSGSTATIIGINMSPLLAKEEATQEVFENDTEGAEIVGLRRIEDGSIISNTHTIKWRVFTDHARDLFMKGKLKEAEGFFVSALKEAKEGFGEREAHVASACNNLAELYRVNKAFDKAEPLYLEAINILEETYGTDDIRVGAALHNIGQFYLAQNKLEDAGKCYERALKIKGRVLGLNHSEYADTMYHLGMVLHLQGNEKDSEALILDSIKIMEETEEAESMACFRRMLSLAQIYLKSNRVRDAENIQRKMLQNMELTKGWDSLDTVLAAERLALTLQSAGNLEEAQELLERCLKTRIALLPKDHIQIGANGLFLARLAMLKANKLRKLDHLKAIKELDKAKTFLQDTIRISQKNLDILLNHIGKLQSYGVSERAKQNGHEALVILLQSFNALGHLEITKTELQESKNNDRSPVVEAENALFRCVSAYKKFEFESLISKSSKVKAEYASCLKYLVSLIGDNTTERRKLSKGLDIRDFKREIELLEADVSPHKNPGN